MRIGELADLAGTSTKTLRFYEEQGLLPPPTRTPAGYRDYGEVARARLDFIRRGQRAGLTLAQIGQVLQIRDGGEAPCGHVEDLLAQRLAEIEEQISELTLLHTSVQRLLAEARAADPATCEPGQICRYL